MFKKYLKSLTIWQVTQLLLCLIFIAGILLGFIIGAIYQSNEIGTKLRVISEEQNNYFRIDTDAYLISKITISCFPFHDPTECTIINQRSLEQYNVYINESEYT